ncbi:hypothetical protein MPER_03204 [Moniliophthora perniciosa FA553]|nr:hypothetical protein MPER_03204 [Moniliophthora perniciosa FA553]
MEKERLKRIRKTKVLPEEEEYKPKDVSDDDEDEIQIIEPPKKSRTSERLKAHISSNASIRQGDATINNTGSKRRLSSEADIEHTSSNFKESSSYDEHRRRDWSKVKVHLVPSIAGKQEGWPNVVL